MAKVTRRFSFTYWQYLSDVGAPFRFKTVEDTSIAVGNQYALGNENVLPKTIIPRSVHFVSEDGTQELSIPIGSPTNVYWRNGGTIVLYGTLWIAVYRKAEENTYHYPTQTP